MDDNWGTPISRSLHIGTMVYLQIVDRESDWPIDSGLSCQTNLDENPEAMGNNGNRDFQRIAIVFPRVWSHVMWATDNIIFNTL